MSATPYTIRFGADPVQLTFFRFGLGRWLHGLQWPAKDRDDVILAASEACTNSVQHAYVIGDESGDVEVTARLVVGADGRRVAIRVRDWGRWRSAHTDPGRGLVLIRACMEQVRVRRHDHGTSVLMSSKPVPLLDTHAPDVERDLEEA